MKNTKRTYHKTTFILFKYILALLLCTFSLTSTHSQELVYDIVKGKKKLGELHADRYMVDNGFLIDIESNVKFWFFGNRRVMYKLVNKYESKTLISSFSTSTMNDKPRHTTSISYEIGKYKFSDVQDSEINFCDTTHINYTIAYMYFKEPGNIDLVYSERYLKYLPLEKVDDHKYKVSLPGGVKNYFTYDNGLTKEVEINHTLAKFYFKRKDLTTSENSSSTVNQQDR